MGAPNLLQQLYLKTALNESKDGMFDHPADLEEGNHMRAVRLARAGRYDAAALASNKAEASEMRRGGASKRSIKARFNKKDYAVGSKAHQRFEKAATKKRGAALKAKGIAEALDEGYHKKALRLIRAGDWERAAEQGDRDEASALMRGGASKRTMKRHFNDQDYAAGRGAIDRFEKAAAKKRDAALKAKGLAEQSITEGLLSKLERLDEANFNTHRPLSSSMGSTNYADRIFAAHDARQKGLKKAAEERAARLAAEKAAKKAKK